jgi:hypothetical protein
LPAYGTSSPPGKAAGTVPTLFNDSEDAPTRGDNRFVIVLASAHDQVLEFFDAAGWEPAIRIYREKLQGGRYPEPVALRRARPHEVSASEKAQLRSA